MSAFRSRAWNQIQSNTTAYQGKGKCHRASIKIKVKIREPPEARENARDNFRFILAMHLIGRECGTNFLDQSQRKC